MSPPLALHCFESKVGGRACVFACRLRVVLGKLFFCLFVCLFIPYSVSCFHTLTHSLTHSLSLFLSACFRLSTSNELLQSSPLFFSCAFFFLIKERERERA